MRVLLAHKFFNVTGGAEVFFHLVGDALKENGHEVAKFSTDNENAVPTEKTKNDFFGHFYDYNASGTFSKISALSGVIYSKKNKKKFRKVLEEFKPDIVHVFAIFSTISPSILDACAEAKVKVVMSCNDYKHICPNYKLYHHGKICLECQNGKFYNAIKNKCCKDSLSFSIASALEAYVHKVLSPVRGNVDKFLFSSVFMAKMTQKFWSDETLDYGILQNPFDSEQYKPSFIYGDYILYFGRLVEEKGVDILIKAMKNVPHIKLFIVGNGDKEEELKKLKEELKLENVTFLGPKYDKELDPYLKDARFTVVPSLWHENFPYVINQSFAYAKAVVGSDKGGIPELIQNGEFGLVYPAEDVEKLSVSLKEMYDTPDLAKDMGMKAKKWSDKNFSYKIFYKNLMNIYSGVLEK